MENNIFEEIRASEEYQKQLAENEAKQKKDVYSLKIPPEIHYLKYGAFASDANIVSFEKVVRVENYTDKLCVYYGTDDQYCYFSKDQLENYSDWLFRANS